MKAFKNQGIMYSSDYFTEETVAELFKNDERGEASAVEQEGPNLNAVFVGVTGPNTAFKNAWTEAQQDPKFKAQAKKRGYTRKIAFAEFQRTLTAPIASSLDSATAALMPSEITVQVTDDAYTHHVDGVQVLSIPKAVSGAALASKQAEVILQSIFVVIDAFFLVVAAMGVSIAVRKEAIAPKLKTIGGKLKGMFNGLAKEMKQLEQQEKKLEIAVKVLKGVSGVKGFSVKDTILAILSGMSWWEKSLAVVQLVAAIGLLVATGGGSVLKQMAQLGLAIAAFMTDVVELIELIVAPEKAA